MPGIMSLERELFPEDAWTPEMFAAEFAQPASRRLYLVAEEGNALTGYAGMMFTGGPQADVVTLAVDPAHWGHGTGTALLSWEPTHETLLEDLRFGDYITQPEVPPQADWSTRLTRWLSP